MIEALILLVASVCVNEAGFDSQADCQLIWQVVEGHSSTVEGQLRWLRNHSAKVSGLRECTRGNCLWTRNLTPDGARPEGSTAPYWNENWFPRVHGWAADLVEGRDLARPCPSTPDTWDGLRWLDRSIERGYTPLGCQGTRNEGFLYPRRQTGRGLPSS